MKTKEEREQIVETASSLCSLDGYSKDKDLFQPYIEGTKSLDDLLQEELKSYSFLKEPTWLFCFTY